MDSLPDELHLAIASYLDDRKDSANYRLTSKRFARIGAEPYFKTLNFGRCLLDQALERIRAVAASPFAKFVDGFDSDGENKSNVDAPPRRRISSVLLPSERYIERRQHLYEIAKEFHETGLRLNSVQLRNIVFDVFGSSWDANTLARACASVKELGLFFGSPSIVPHRLDLQMAEYNMRIFLAVLHDLEVLSITFPVGGSIGYQHRLCDLVPRTQIGPRLRELTLFGVVFTAPDIVTLLSNHADTLEYVWLQALELDDPEELGGPADARPMTKEEEGQEWRKVFAQIAKMKLRHVYLTKATWLPAIYKVWDSCVMRWIVDGDDGQEVFVRTNLVDFLDDEWEDDSDYDGEHDSGDDSEEDSDDSEFWSDESEG
jgi:hypothetical protein